MEIVGRMTGTIRYWNKVSQGLIMKHKPEQRLGKTSSKSALGPNGVLYEVYCIKETTVAILEKHVEEE